MCGSALVPWGGCGTSHGTTPRFHIGRTCSEIVGIFPWEQVCELKSSACLTLTLQTATGCVWPYRRLCFSVVPLLLLGCILPQCEFINSAKLFPGLLGRRVSPRACPAFPAGSTSLQLPALPAPALSPPHQPNTSKLHTHSGQSLLLCPYYWNTAMSEKRCFRK